MKYHYTVPHSICIFWGIWCKNTPKDGLKYTRGCAYEMCKHFVVLHKELGELQTFVIHSSKLSLNQSLAGKKELDDCLYDKKTALTINKSCCHIGLRLPKI